MNYNLTNIDALIDTAASSARLTKMPYVVYVGTSEVVAGVLCARDWVKHCTPETLLLAVAYVTPEGAVTRSKWLDEQLAVAEVA